MNRTSKLLAAVAATAALAWSPAWGHADADPPRAGASKSCGNVSTRDGGRARFVNVVRARCGIARRVARQADGRRYSFLGFDCRWERKPRVRGKLYGCGRIQNGRGQGVGFVYRAP